MRSTGLAIETALELLSYLNEGPSRITLFIGGPSTLGPGPIAPLEHA